MRPGKTFGVHDTAASESVRAWASPYARLEDRYPVVCVGDEVEFSIRSLYLRDNPDVDPFRARQIPPERTNHHGVVIKVDDVAYFYVPRYGYVYHPMVTNVRRIYRGDVLVTQTSGQRRVPRPPSLWPFFDHLSPGYDFPTPNEVVLRVGDVVEYRARISGRVAHVRGVMVTPLTMSFCETPRRYGRQRTGPVEYHNNFVSVATNPISRVWREGVLLAQVRTMAWPTQFCTEYVPPDNIKGYPQEWVERPEKEPYNPPKQYTRESLNQRLRERDAYWNTLSRRQLEAIAGQDALRKRRPDGSFDIPFHRSGRKRR